MKFQASLSLQGVQLSEDDSPKESNVVVNGEDHTIPLFGDPEEYKKLSPEEAQRLTDKMMGFHKQWSTSSAEAKKSKIF